MFKQLADKKKEVFDEDIIAIVEEQIAGAPEMWKLNSFSVTSGNTVVPKATVELKIKNKVVSAESSGDGPVDACFKAVDKSSGVKPKLLNYSLQALTKGKDAQGEVTLRMIFKGREILAKGSSTDIIEASIKAYLNGVNKISYKKAKYKARL
jgi:2-isopropylmalate synthase